MKRVFDSPQYFMEGQSESARLSAKDNSETTYAQLIETGITELNGEPHLLDAGTGVGVVAKQMAVISRHAFPRATISLIDSSSERLSIAFNNIGSYDNLNINALHCPLESINLPDNSVDYVFCRFVFEYLSDPQLVFDELTRVLKPGGKLVVGDLDNNGLSHYPIDDDLMMQVNELMLQLQNKGCFDFHAGRKLFGFFHHGNFKQVKVHFHAHHLTYGNLSSIDEQNWIAKLDRLIAHEADGVFEVSFDLAEFKERILEMVRSPDYFSYCPLILVEGVKP